MATTSLWHIKGNLKDLISYVENPEKTVPNQEMQDFFDVFSYVKNPQKTNEDQYVSAVNCLKETALQQMILTKKQYQKTGGYIAWHGYQGFKVDEITPGQCHEIGLKLAREMWGGKYQIIVATHLGKGHLHNISVLTPQVRYMSKQGISTRSDLHADREQNQTEMNKLIDYRQHLRNKVRRATPAEKETLRAKKQGVTEQITELRKRLKYADGIEKRSAHIDNCLNQFHDMIENQRSNRQKQPVKTDRRREELLR